MKFFIDNIWLIGLALLSGGMLILPYVQRRGQKVSLLQATQRINQGNVCLLDVREADEYATGHLRGSLHIPMKELAQRIGELEKSKSKVVIAVCQTGVRSSSATAQLKKAGFAEVYSLDGGVAAWQAQGLPVVK